MFHMTDSLDKIFNKIFPRKSSSKVRIEERKDTYGECMDLSLSHCFEKCLNVLHDTIEEK